MKNGNKVRVKFKLDKHRFVVLEVEEEKLPIVRENNREVSRNEKRENQQAIIQKVYFEEKSQREVSKELGVTESAISIQLARAIEKMKKFLEK